jgi:hypothetical protein
MTEDEENELRLRAVRAERALGALQAVLSANVAALPDAVLSVAAAVARTYADADRVTPAEYVGLTFKPPPV